MHFPALCAALLSLLVMTSSVHAIACVPIPTLEDPDAMSCVPDLPPPPPAPAPDTDAPTVTSISASANQTNVPYTVTVVFSEALDGFTIDDFENLAPEVLTFSNLTAVDDRTYTVMVTGPDGVHRIHIKNESATDAAGNALVSPEEVAFETAVFYDTTPPTVTMTNAPLHNTVSRGPIQFEYYSDDTAATYRCTFIPGTIITGAEYVPCNIPEGETAASFVPALVNEGVYTFAIIATDELGNERAPAESDMTLITFTYDTTSPNVSIVVPVATPSLNTTPLFTLQTDEPITLAFFGPCGDATPSAVARGQHLLTFNVLRPGTYSTRKLRIVEGLEPMQVSIEGALSKEAPEESTVCYLSASDAAGNALFHTLSTFVISEPLVPVVGNNGGGGNGPITVVTGSSTVTIESSTPQPGGEGRVIIGQSSIVPGQSTVVVQSGTFAAAGGTPPPQPSTVLVVQSQPVITQQTPRRVAQRVPRRNAQVRPQRVPPLPTNTPVDITTNQTASAAGASTILWRYILSFFGY